MSLGVPELNRIEVLLGGVVVAAGDHDHQAIGERVTDSCTSGRLTTNA